MLHYSFSTVLMTVLTSNIIIVLIALCFQHKKILLSIGYKLLIVFLILTFARFLFPFELPFSRNVILPEFLSAIISYFLHAFYNQNDIRISLWTVFKFIWIVGILYKLGKYIYQYISTERHIIMWSIDVTEEEPYKTILSDICKKHKNRFRVLKVPGVTVPCLYGLFKPRILIPAEIELSKTDLYFTLRHEISHHYHRDLWVKRLVSFLGIIYWWNPACSKLRTQTDLLLEMRIDDSLVKGDPQAIKAYLRTLTHIVDSAVTISTLPASLLVSMAQKNPEVLVKRFEMMSHEKDRASIPLSILLCAVVLSLCLGSYLFTFENFYAVESNVDGTFDAKDGVYVVPREDGKYDIYYGDSLLEVIDSMEFYSDVPIITK